MQLEGERLPNAFRNKTLKIAYSSSPLGDSGAVDPEFLAKGASTSNDLKGLPGLFWLVSSSPINSDGPVVARGGNRYTAEVTGDLIYNSEAGVDKLGYWRWVRSGSWHRS